MVHTASWLVGDEIAVLLGQWVALFNGISDATITHITQSITTHTNETATGDNLIIDKLGLIIAEDSASNIQTYSIPAPSDSTWVTTGTMAGIVAKPEVIATLEEGLTGKGIISKQGNVVNFATIAVTRAI
jgi:hypothetical protein